MTDAVKIERHFDAPRSLVWAMWTDPQHVANWYGPDGASVTIAEMDVRVGGRRLLCMAIETPGGPMQMWFTGEFLEIVPEERLAYTDLRCDEHGAVLSPSEAGFPDSHSGITHVTVELQELEGKSKVTLTHAGIPSDSPGATGWNQSLTKLAAYLGGVRG